MDDFYTAALVGTVGLTLAIPLVPPVEDLVTTSDLMRSLTIAVMSVGYGAASYDNGSEYEESSSSLYRQKLQSSSNQSASHARS
jgi:hypothetical protein